LGWTARLLGEKEKEKFDTFVAAAPKGHILQSYEWGEVKAGTGWVPLRLVVEDNGSIVAAVSLLERKVPVINKNIFYAPRGPVLDYSNIELFDFLLEEIAKVAAKRGAFVFKIDPDLPSSDSAVDMYLRQKGFQSQANQDFDGIQPRYVFRMDITPDLDKLFADMQIRRMQYSQNIPPNY
jgi:lipid II:glycine glycyltransferase (peptidoglycan interpeptide bridge formation enzyme)